MYTYIGLISLISFNGSNFISFKKNLNLNETVKWSYSKFKSKEIASLKSSHHFISALSGTYYNFPRYYWTTSMYSTTWIQNWSFKSSIHQCHSDEVVFFAAVLPKLFLLPSVTMCHLFHRLIRAYSPKKSYLPFYRHGDCWCTWLFLPSFYFCDLLH